jgi:hypothetical protein
MKPFLSASVAEMAFHLTLQVLASSFILIRESSPLSTTLFNFSYNFLHPSKKEKKNYG